MASITLYGPGGAPFVIKVHRALRFKGLDHRLVEPSGPEDYRRWNPETGLLPVLDLDGERVHDSTAILFALDEKFPEPPLVSSDPKTAEAQRRLEDWCDESFFFYWTRWQRLRTAEPVPAGAPAREGWRARLGWLRSRRRRKEEGSSRAQELVTELAQRLDDLVTLLGRRPFFYAEQPSLADFAVFAMLASLRADSLPNGRALLAQRPPLIEFMKRVEQATGG